MKYLSHLSRGRCSRWRAFPSSVWHVGITASTRATHSHTCSHTRGSYRAVTFSHSMHLAFLLFRTLFIHLHIDWSIAFSQWVTFSCYCEIKCNLFSVKRFPFGVWCLLCISEWTKASSASIKYDQPYMGKGRGLNVNWPMGCAIYRRGGAFSPN